MDRISIIIPALNEAKTIAPLVRRLHEVCSPLEVVVVDDGSNDDTRQLAEEAGARVVSHPYSMGNGAAVKTGARSAKGETLVFLDADGQHRPEEIPQLLERLDQGYDMAVGARTSEGQANAGRALANRFYNRLASFMVDHRVDDLTSGFRAVRAQKFREFLHLLPNGFSYPTTITMAFFRAGYGVSYVPIAVQAREGKSHIRPIKDGLRFLLIIFRISTLYSPLKLFFPLALFSGLLGTTYAAYTLGWHGRFTNMTATLLVTAVIIFLIGLVSEQVTALMYQGTNRRRLTDSGDDQR
ncbi:glycosyltransferase family 2 protein [Ectothiorhodospiraceae bacterium WFHF3C12]|nr:glycosyltransferase family 2 protein [Ectothiorhodospiraceae bacterium WFHF3C12]